MNKQPLKKQPAKVKSASQKNAGQQTVAPSGVKLESSVRAGGCPCCHLC